LERSLADRAKGKADLLRNATATQLQVVELERELKQVHVVAAAEKRKLEDELTEEKHKTQEANAQFNAASIRKIRNSYHLLSCVAGGVTSEYIAGMLQIFTGVRMTSRTT
jgi:hypothetical protein